MEENKVETINAVEAVEKCLNEIEKHADGFMAAVRNIIKSFEYIDVENLSKEEEEKIDFLQYKFIKRMEKMGKDFAEEFN